MTQQGIDWHHCQGLLAGQLVDCMFLLSWNFSRDFSDLSTVSIKVYLSELSSYFTWTLLGFVYKLRQSDCIFCQLRICLPQVGQDEDLWELLWLVTPQGLDKLFFYFLHSDILITFSTGLLRWSWLWRTDSKASTYLTMSLSDVGYLALARRSVCNDSLYKTQMNWSLTWTDCKSTS